MSILRNIPVVSSLLYGRNNQSDPEKGRPMGHPATNSPPGAPTMNYVQADGAPHQNPTYPEQYPVQTRTPIVHEVVPADDRLANFRRLVGIDSAPTLADTTYLQRRAPNVGIYTRTVKAEVDCKRQFKLTSIMINSCLGLQIIVAASLTALGAAGGSRAAVTAFGAINTVIAGFLTYLKGSGLPNRFKYFEGEWRRVREYIEQREREFSMAECTLNVEEEARAVYAMYEDVRADIEASVPDGYRSANKSAINNVKANVFPGIADSQRATTSVLDPMHKGLEKELERGQSGLEKGLGAVHRGMEMLDKRLHKDVERGQQGLQDTISRGQDSIIETRDRAHQGIRGEVEGGVERGLAALQARIEKLDEGLDKIGLERKKHDSEKSHDEKKDTPEKSSGPSI